MRASGVFCATAESTTKASHMDVCNLWVGNPAPYRICPVCSASFLVNHTTWKNQYRTWLMSHVCSLAGYVCRLKVNLTCDKVMPVTDSTIAQSCLHHSSTVGQNQNACRACSCPFLHLGHTPSVYPLFLRFAANGNPPTYMRHMNSLACKLKCMSHTLDRVFVHHSVVCVRCQVWYPLSAQSGIVINIL